MNQEEQERMDHEKHAHDGGVVSAGVASASGAVLAGLATAAGVCCVPVIAPMTVAVLGAGGAAWAAGLGPYSGWILAGSAALLVLAHWWLRRPARGGDSCRRRPPRIVSLIVWSSTALWGLSLALQLWVNGWLGR